MNTNSTALALIASLGLLSACSSSSAQDASASEMGGKGSKVKVNPGKGGGGSTTTTDPSTSTDTTTTPAPAPVPTLVYDTSIGMGVDSTGSANLPLRSGAHRYFVNSATGSDANGCGAAQNAATPMRSMAAGITCVQMGNGDQLLVAEGTSYSERLPNLDVRGGFSPEYPTVLQSYDPSDPMNESKYGRAANGRRPVINTGANAQTTTCCSKSPASYLAIRGFDINPGNVPDMVMIFVGSNGLPNNYILIENNIFRYTELDFTQPPTSPAVHHVVRKNAFYGSWSTSAHAQGLYNRGTDSLTVEDNVFWHAGWKPGISRDTDSSLGGPTMFNHSVYQQSSTNAVIRRNLFMDSSATGCMCRGDTSIQENVFIDEPIAISVGTGDDYSVSRPNGIAVDIGYNAIIGDANINSANPRGTAIWTGNGKQGSTAHNNLIVRSRNPVGTNVYAFITEAVYNQPSYMNYDSNLVYAFSARMVSTGAFPAQDFASYTNNVWDAPSSGTNANNGGTSFPNSYTEAQLFAALGCTDKPTCAARMVESPEFDWAVKARALLWQGYGL